MVAGVTTLQPRLRAGMDFLLLTCVSLSLARREKYLNTLLQVEAMLKLWFPHIPVQPVSAPPGNTTFLSGSLQDTSNLVPPHKHRDQLHIPVKVRWCSALRRIHAFFTESSVPIDPRLPFLEASAQLDGHGLPHAVPRSLQVPSPRLR